MPAIKILSLVFALLFSVVSHAEEDTNTINVKFETSSGDFIVELYPDKAPLTVRNFLRYVEEGFYKDTIFHRVIKGFMIQGGGFTKDFAKKDTHLAIKNEASNGLINTPGTIAMARTNNPNSATSQFFINTEMNSSLNYIENRNPGYAVFGKVTEGYEVIKQIESEPTGRYKTYGDVPKNQVVIKNVSRL